MHGRECGFKGGNARRGFDGKICDLTYAIDYANVARLGVAGFAFGKSEGAGL
jgi:hypothetical protein